MNHLTPIEIYGNRIGTYGEKVLKTLLFDRTTRRNIIWGTFDYEEYGEEYKAQYPINIHLITGMHKDLIQPRIYKEKYNQVNRIKAKAEVFTPSWMCNEQNNLVDREWFGREGVFNIQQYKKWIATTKPIAFSDKRGKRWTDYVDAKRMEITCGEAPYLVSRYDAVSGEHISLERRIGLLDRKMRVVSENANTYDLWMKWAKRAFESIYGFEYQGDNLLLARENLLYTFIDFYKDKFNREPEFRELNPIALVISWNIWQMDGLTNTVPFTMIMEQCQQISMFDIYDNNKNKPCYCKIHDWRSKKTITFDTLLRQKRREQNERSKS